MVINNINCAKMCHISKNLCRNKFLTCTVKAQYNEIGTNMVWLITLWPVCDLDYQDLLL